MYVNVEIYKVEQRQINIVYFIVDINNVRQRRNNAVICNVDFHNVDQSKQRCEYDHFQTVEKSKKNIFELQKKKDD